ncbi:MAG: thymidylate synthase [Rhodobacteraceae bacterium]|nr:MAG: thymidylate synthase [Paracoccaceae bacterium]
MSIIISLNKKGLMGINNDLAFSSQVDLKRFSELTKTIGNVVMGSNTWCSLPRDRRPLPDRLNVVVTNNYYMRLMCNARTSTLDNVFNTVEEPCFIGGASLLKSLISSKYIRKIKKIYLTEYEDDSEPKDGVYVDLPFHDYSISSQYKSVLTNVSCYNKNKPELQKVNYITFTRRSVGGLERHPENELTQSLLSCMYIPWSASPNYEKNYLDYLKEIIDLPIRHTRNGNTHSMFGVQLKYDCSNGLVPLLTTKKMAWKTVIKELLWFISGDTDNKTLVEQNVHIWDGNASRDFLDSRGLTSRAEGDLGPVYGFQWRHWGEKYISSRSHYKGIDQLRLCEKMLIEDPYSRRIIMTAWNPSQINEMALPPCHILIQWYVDYSEKLWLQFYQRSGDMFLGIPFNMFSYSVLLHIMALRTGLSPGGVVHCIGDAHVYENHVDAVKKQLKNNIHPSPTINIRSSRTSVFDDGTGTQVSMRRQKDWNEYSIEDFSLENYVCANKISAKMSA